MSRSAILQSVEVDPRKYRIKVFLSGDAQYYQLRALQRALPSVVVKGIPSIQRAIINVRSKSGPAGNKGDKELLVEGYGLQNVMTTEGMSRIDRQMGFMAKFHIGIVGEHTTSNHVMEVEKVLGIEAARRTVINEIQFTMSEHGMSIDPRHVMLLGDVMTYKVTLCPHPPVV